jgi:hypothetical protein
MFANRRHFVAAVLLMGIVGGCSSASATATAATAAGATPAGASTPAGLPTPTASLAATSVPTSGGGPSATGGPVAGGGNLCSLLGPGDFAAAGVSGAGSPIDSPDGTGGHYCVYAGVSGATGGIEFDAFIGDPVGTYRTIASDTGMGTLTAVSTADLPGADQAGMTLDSIGHMAAIVVRKGQLTFDMSFPTNPNARTQLIALVDLVLQRGTALY